jgi:hypothetical protein
MIQIAHNPSWKKLFELLEVPHAIGPFGCGEADRRVRSTAEDGEIISAAKD